MTTACSVALLLLVGLPAALAAGDGKAKFPAITMSNFRATLTSTATGDKVTSVLAANRKELLLLQQNPLPDGRPAHNTFDFKENCTYQEQPFFNETVCYKMPLVNPSGGGYSEAGWTAQLFNLLQIPNSPEKMDWEIKGTKKVDGKTCTIYLNHQGPCCEQTICIDDIGNVHSTTYTTKDTGGGVEVIDVTLTDFTTEEDLKRDSGCVDLLGPKGPAGMDWEHVAANDAELIRRANEEAGGEWVAEASPVFEGMSLAEAAKRHGTGMAVPRLPPHSTELSAGDADIPDSFDARDHWKNCPSIGQIRNQGDCGSCWAFAANEAFADRLCIGGGTKDFTAAVEYMLDCDKKDQGCNGGFLDDAWKFLENTGVPVEKCDPYTHCPDPATPTCKPKFSPAFRGPPPVQPKCPSKCKDGSSLDLKKAKSAYMVAKPGDVKGMQKEIMTNGPVEVAFFVYSDFQAYKSGVYFRTPSAQGPLGGHAVRVLGWGTEQGKDYWLVANSWSPEWGDHGYFKIRRGTNECGIETIPAAGLADVSATEIVV